MPERIYKLQPDRTMALRGFDDLGAAAALHSATPSGFKVSGVFRDPADFAVLMLWDADNVYEHPRLRYLPDMSFQGMTLQFDVRYTGLMPLESIKYPTIDWPFLNVLLSDGVEPVHIRLSDQAVQTGGTLTAAECSFTIVDNGSQAGDQITIWYENHAFDYTVPAGQSITADSVAAALAAAVGSTSWGGSMPLTASSDGPVVKFTAGVPGSDGNLLRLQAVSKNSRLTTSETIGIFSGGVSDAVWRVTIRFADHLAEPALAKIRQMWLTFAPPLANGVAFESTEWEAVFSNWSVADPLDKRKLAVAGPLSVRVEETDQWCQYSGSWSIVNTGFYSQGTGKRTTSSGSSVTVKYSCASAHDLYVGTMLGSDCGQVQVRVDNGTPITLDCWLDSKFTPILTRRPVKSGMAPGEHTVVFTSTSNKEFHFDFLEAAVPGDVPDALPENTRVSPALDYSTDHTYKLPPARIHWNFDRLGYAAPMNEYIGVFWWNQRKRSGGTMPEARIEFSGTFDPGDGLFLKIGPADDPTVFRFGKYVFATDTSATIAQYYANYLNGYSVGVWASADGNTLTITSRSAKAAWRFPLSISKESPTSSTGTCTITGSLETGEIGNWMVDPEQTPALNRGARDWHADMFRECHARNREITVACSMELVNPPVEFAAMFADGRPVMTHVGFGQLTSTHCHFGTGMRAYQTSVYSCIADLQAAAGLTPSVQFGEFLWWFFTSENPGAGMAFYDPETEAAAQAALGRPLHRFLTPVDDPGVNGRADATFLRNRLRDHVSALVANLRAVHPNILCEVLFPYDVNHPEPAGIHSLGGRLNRFVNLPVEWEQKATCGFDRMKTEALDFGAYNRNLDLAKTAFMLPISLGWEKPFLRHLVPIFRAGYAWEKEVEMALAAGIPIVNLWAWDHIGLFGLAVTPAAKGRSAQSE